MWRWRQEQGVGTCWMEQILEGKIVIYFGEEGQLSGWFRMCVERFFFFVQFGQCFIFYLVCGKGFIFIKRKEMVAKVNDYSYLQLKQVFAFLVLLSILLLMLEMQSIRFITRERFGLRVRGCLVKRFGEFVEGVFIFFWGIRRK